MTRSTRNTAARPASSTSLSAARVPATSPQRATRTSAVSPQRSADSSAADGLSAAAAAVGPSEDPPVLQDAEQPTRLRTPGPPISPLKVKCYGIYHFFHHLAVLRIRDILVRIRILFLLQ